jgi:hypothetical protein
MIIAHFRRFAQWAALGLGLIYVFKKSPSRIERLLQQGNGLVMLIISKYWWWRQEYLK